MFPLSMSRYGGFWNTVEVSRSRDGIPGLIVFQFDDGIRPSCLVGNKEGCRGPIDEDDWMLEWFLGLIK